MNRLLPFAAVVVVISLPSIAFAHPGHGPAGHGLAGQELGGLVHGLLHPLTGIDHLLSLIAVAVLSVRLGGRALWAVPAAFLLMGVVGGGVAALGWSLPMAQTMVVATVLIGGFTLALHRTLPRFLLTAITVFGLFHGSAHFSELTGSSAVALYASGLIAASLGVMLAVIATGRWVERSRSNETFATTCRYIGGSLTAAAIALMLF
ncbi:HupE / UreJ protein [Novipirellula galeiformis]|uniref:HupE / UreJ protein n=1 Tax=Novipirellula galeiformis TaxID=2528004 RepID=A0A5C6CPK3_9BACT|nr:HupE/UreJ family protein [Novipirellula galeiformis]TWU24986.1 HupE / UreJ protein [Novipirellula galeiformis]